jgi:hypothetical protein
MSGERRTARDKAQRPPAEPTADDLERLAAELVRRLGARARYLAALIDEATEATASRPPAKLPGDDSAL